MNNLPIHIDPEGNGISACVLLCDFWPPAISLKFVCAFTAWQNPARRFDQKQNAVTSLYARRNFFFQKYKVWCWKCPILVNLGAKLKFWAPVTPLSDICSWLLENRNFLPLNFSIRTWPLTFTRQVIIIDCCMHVLRLALTFSGDRKSKHATLRDISDPYCQTTYLWLSAPLHVLSVRSPACAVIDNVHAR